MRLIKQLLCIIVFLLLACRAPGYEEFVQVVIDHNYAVERINNQISSAVHDRLVDPDLSEAEVEELNNLLQWLDYACVSGELIYQYITSDVDEEFIATLIKNRWNRDDQ